MEMTMRSKAIPAVGDKVFLRRSHIYKNEKAKFKYSSSDELVLLKKAVIGGYFDDDIREEATLKDEKTGNIFTVSFSKVSLSSKDFPYLEMIMKTIGGLLILGLAVSLVVGIFTS